MHQGDYFLHFGMPRKYRLDAGELRKKFYALSRESHPDMHGGVSEAAEANAFNNTAYKTLSDPQQRLLHILQLEGCEGMTAASPDQFFLMEMMEMGEMIDNLRAQPDEALRSQTEKKLDELEALATEESLPAITQYDDGLRNEDIMRTLADLYIRQRYFRRLRMSLRGENEV